MKYIPEKKFNACVKRHEGDKWCKTFFCWDLFLVLLHGQIHQESSLRSLELSYNHAQGNQRNNEKVSRSTLSDACKKRKELIFMEVFTHLLRQLPKQNVFKRRLKKFVHLIDSTPIQLRGKRYAWTKSNHFIKGMKVHVVYDSELKSPVYFRINDANVNDITEAKRMEIASGGIYVYDKGYHDYGFWNAIDKQGSYFVTRLKKDAPFKVHKARNVLAENILQDCEIKLTSQAGKKYLKRIRYIEVRLSNGKKIVIISNDLRSSAKKLSALYKQRWEIELFFKCIKQNLKIKRFWGSSENAVKLQLIIALIVYVLLR